MRAGIIGLASLLGAIGMGGRGTLGADPVGLHVVDRSSTERGRVALTLTGFLKPEWSASAYGRAGKLWTDQPAPNPETQPGQYDAAFRRQYGLHPAPFPNDGLPLGLRRGVGPDGARVGLQIDCMVCHGGSIGGKSYVGLGNTQLDLRSLLTDLITADGRRPPPPTFVLNSSRGTNNAGQIAAILLSLRNSDLSLRRFPLPLAANLPELDTPPWWHLKRKRSMYYDGRTDALSVRSNMQFMLGEKTLDQLKAMEPTFRDVQSYIQSIEAPKYPFAIESATAQLGHAVFERSCARCHGTYGPGGTYPNKMIAIEMIGTDSARLTGLSDRLVAHYNSTWLGAETPVDTEKAGYQCPPLDGIWASAPYLHNGSVPTLAALLDSSKRPKRFTRPPSTDFEHYDRERVGWKFQTVTASEQAATTKASPFKAKFIVDTSRYGMGNGGHTFGDRLSENERIQLIEYLKTL